jgi:hypothetical protein
MRVICGSGRYEWVACADAKGFTSRAEEFRFA